MVIDRVYLHATDESALKNGVTMEALQKFAAEPEAVGGGRSAPEGAAITPNAKGGVVTETH